MEWYTWVPGLVSAIIAGAALWRSIAAEKRAQRSDERAERIERLERVRFEIVRAPEANKDPSVFALRNLGTDTAMQVEIDPASVLGQAFLGSPSLYSLNPGSMMIFGMGNPGEVPQIPSSIRVTWRGPFPGEAHVPFPLDDSAPWSYGLGRHFG